MRLPSIILCLIVTMFCVSIAHADDWPQWFGPQRDGVWRETGIIDKFPEGGAKVLWRTPISDGYAGPAVAKGRVYVMDFVRAAPAKPGEDPFKVATLNGKERLSCLEETTGKVLWTSDYDCHYEVSYPGGPRATPTVAGDKVYTLGTMGDLRCVTTEGKLVWSKKLREEFKVREPMWGYNSPPLVDGNRVICIVGAKDGLVMAFDKDKGDVLWKRLDDTEPGYSAPVIHDIGGTRQLVIWHPQAIDALNPETGAPIWSVPMAGKGVKGAIKVGMTNVTPRFDKDHVLLTTFYEGAVLLKLNGTKKPEVVWRGNGRSEAPEDTQTIHSIMSTPVFKDGYIYGTCSYGELRCIKESTGERVWETFKATTGESMRWGNAFIVPNGDRFILFNEKGDLIIANLSPKGYEEISRAHVIEPTNSMAAPAGRRVVWTFPAFADKCIFVRNDREIICVQMAGRDK